MNRTLTLALAGLVATTGFATSASANPKHALALQLRFLSDVSVSCDGLVRTAPYGPGNHMSGFDPALSQAHCHAPDLLHRPADQRTPATRTFVFGGGNWFAR